MTSTTNALQLSTNRLEQRQRLLVAPLLVLLVAGCTDGPGGPESGGGPLIVQLISVDSIGIAGGQLSGPLKVVVRDWRGVQAGARVHWSTTSGRIEPSVSTTDARGVARAQWILGDQVGSVEATARVERDGATSSLAIRTLALEPVSLVPVAETNNQRARIGTALQRQLQVRVTSAAGPKRGVAVHWSVSAGTIGPMSLTDSDGVAESMWTMPNLPGTHSAYAAVAGAREGPVAYAATAITEVVSRVVALETQTRTLPANVFARETLTIYAYDKLDNPVFAAPITWSTTSGILRVVSAQRITDSRGRAQVVVAPVGEPGSAIVRVGSGYLEGDFHFLLTPRSVSIRLQTESSYAFVSMQNQTRPAYDTAYVGETVSWYLDPFDYDIHHLAIEGVPNLPANGRFPYAYPSAIRWTFTVPGIYQYSDMDYGGAGTLVVLPLR